MANVTAKAAHFDRTQLNRAKMDNSDFSSASFVETDLRDIFAYGTSFYNANLARTLCGGATFQLGTLTHASAVGADLRGANFKDARIGDLDLKACRVVVAELQQAENPSRNSTRELDPSA